MAIDQGIGYNKPNVNKRALLELSMDRYNSVNNTKNDFRIAFWKLYKRNSVEKISVSELCRVAGYNRTTFYVYYDNIHDLLLRCIEEMLRPIKEHADELQLVGVPPEDKGKLAQLYLETLMINKEYVRLLIEHHQLYILEDQYKAILRPVLLRMFADAGLPAESLHYMLEYQMAAGVNVIAQWFEKQDLGEQEIIDLMVKCAMQGVGNMLNANKKAPADASQQDEAVIQQIIKEMASRKNS